MTRSKRYEITQEHAKPAKWRCQICDATGEANSQRLAMSLFYEHYRQAHLIKRGK